MQGKYWDRVPAMKQQLGQGLRFMAPPEQRNALHAA